MEGLEDRLSTQPNDAIANILSRLPTTDAVATCVLSKDWIQKWTCIYNVDIDDEKLEQKCDKIACFLKFLRKTLINLQSPRRIHLDLSVSQLRIFNRGTHFLDLSNDTSIEDFVLLDSLLDTGSLENLSLLFLTWKIPAANHFPNLIILKLQNVCVSNKNSNTRTLIFTFPVAKDISLQNCTWSATKVEIHAPVLNRFMSSVIKSCHYDYTINIHVAKLENFCSCDLLEIFILADTTVVSATLENTEDFSNQGRNLLDSGVRIRNLLKEFSSSIEDLTLSFFLAQAFLEARHRVPLSVFEKLRRLVLGVGPIYDGGNTQELFELLHATPSLKILVINMEEWPFYDYDAVESVPSCIISNLEEVELCVSSWDHLPEVIALAKFLLETGAQLKSLRYLIGGAQRADYIMEKLSSFSRASSDAVLSVYKE